MEAGGGVSGFGASMRQTDRISMKNLRQRADIHREE